MVRTEKATEQATQEAAVDESTVDIGGPELRGGQIVEDAPGVGPAVDTTAPLSEPGDLSSSGGQEELPDLGVGNDSAIGDLTDPGTDLGLTLLDDLTGGSDVPDPTDGIDLIDDGWNPPAIDDQAGWAASGTDDTGGSMDFTSDPLDLTAPASSSAEYLSAYVNLTALSAEAAAGGDAEASAAFAEDAANAWEAHAEALADETAAGESASEEDDRESQYGHSGGGDGPPESQSTPIPDEFEVTGEGGELDPSLTGNIDPDPELEPAGSGGDLIGGRGDVDPDPELRDAGGGDELDMERAGLGTIDPLDDESTLLGGDEGDLGEMIAAADLGSDVEVEFDDSLADADIGVDG